METLKEIWRPISGYEGWFEVSNMGKIRSVDRYLVGSDGRKCHYPSKLLALQTNARGYRIVGLSQNQKRKSLIVHRLVAQAFIANPQNKEQVNHKNSDKTDNRVENLEWVTQTENVRHSVRALTKKTRPIKAFDGENVDFYNSLREAETSTGVDRKTITSNCCDGSPKNKRQIAFDYATSEEIVQQQVIEWVNYQIGKYPELALLHHVPNGMFRHKATAAKLKRLGVKAGVPDLSLPVSRGGFHGLWIELKREKGGTVSTAQSEWIAALIEQGYRVGVCNGFDAAKALIERYMDGKEIRHKSH